VARGARRQGRRVGQVPDRSRDQGRPRGGRIRRRGGDQAEERCPAVGLPGGLRAGLSGGPGRPDRYRRGFGQRRVRRCLLRGRRGGRRRRGRRGRQVLMGDAENTETVAEEAAVEEATAEEQAEVVQEELDELGKTKKERDEYLELAQRAQADFENYRK